MFVCYQRVVGDGLPYVYSFCSVFLFSFSYIDLLKFLCIFVLLSTEW